MIVSGNHYGGPEQRGTVINKALSITMNSLGEFCQNYNDGKTPWVNTVFILSGSITQAGFEGFKTGHYSKKDKGFVIMIAVPEAVAEGKGIQEFITGSLRKACDIATEFFAKKDETFPRDAAEAVITKVWHRLHEFA